MKCTSHCCGQVLLTVAIACMAAAATAETPRIGAATPVLGPQVDVTLRNGDTSKGQLLSFADGNLLLKLENGTVVTQEGSAVVSVVFKSLENQDASTLSAQATELNITEIDRLNVLRWKDNPPRSALAGKQPVSPLNEKEKAELAGLRARASRHIKALEAEVPNVSTEEIAHDKLHELGRYYFFFGLAPQEIRGELHKAVLSIKNTAIERKMDTGMAALWLSFVEKHKGYKQFEKVYEKMIAPPEKPPADGRPPPPPPTDRPPQRPPPNGN